MTKQFIMILNTTKVVLPILHPVRSFALELTLKRLKNETWIFIYDFDRWRISDDKL